MSRFDEEPDGDPHGECAAEIKRLEAETILHRREAIRLFSHKMDDMAQGITERQVYDLATELRVLLGIDEERVEEIADAGKTFAVSQPVALQPSRLPKLPKLSDELYEFYPAMSAETHAHHVKIYAKDYANAAANIAQPVALPQPLLTDDQIDDIQAEAYRELRKWGFNGSMGGFQWDRASARAIETAVRKAWTVNIARPVAPDHRNEWVITAPNGRAWAGETAFRAAAAARRDTVDPVLAMQRINAMVEEGAAEDLAELRNVAEAVREAAAVRVENGAFFHALSPEARIAKQAAEVVRAMPVDPLIEAVKGK